MLYDLHADYHNYYLCYSNLDYSPISYYFNGEPWYKRDYGISYGIFVGTV